jgi:hypothetical protein
MKKLLILITMFTGIANAEIINLKCSNSNNDMDMYLDFNQKVAHAISPLARPVYIIRIRPKIVYGYKAARFDRSELNDIHHFIYAEHSGIFDSKHVDFTIDRETLTMYSKYGFAYNLKGRSQCKIIKNKNLI